MNYSIMKIAGRSSFNKKMYLWTFPCLLVFTFTCRSILAQPSFLNPPESAKPGVWWHWLNGNVTAEGIEKDFEALRKAGFGSVCMFNVGGDYPQGEVLFMSESWNNLFHHALSVAKSQNLRFAFHNCDGWTTAGGPWVKPGHSMKKLVMHENAVHSDGSIRAFLRKPECTTDFYKDIAVLAIPSDHRPLAMSKLLSDVICTDTSLSYQLLYNNNYTDLTAFRYAASQPSELIYYFSEPFMASGLVISTGVASTPLKATISFSDDGASYLPVGQYPLEDKTFQHIKFMPVKAKYFKIVLSDYSVFSTWFGSFQIAELALTSEGDLVEMPAVSNWELKSGSEHSFETRLFFPDKDTNNDQYMSVASVVNLSSLLKNDSVVCRLPEGNWNLMRFGYTLTGEQNKAGTKEGTGLECDKLCGQAVREHVNSFVAELLKSNSEFVTSHTIENVFIDSYESGCQTWTDGFAESFRSKRGYDMLPWLPALYGRGIKNTRMTELFLSDFRKTISEMYADSFLTVFNSVCRDLKVKLMCEPAMTWGMPLVDAVNYASRIDVPKVEFWLNSNPEVFLIEPEKALKDVVSAARLFDKPVVAAEAFTSKNGNWKHAPRNLKIGADQAFCLGVNKLYYSSFDHQPDEKKPGWNLSPWGIAWNRKLTWWDFSEPLNLYVQRCQYVLQKGNAVADVLVYTGNSSPATLWDMYKTNPYIQRPKGYEYEASQHGFAEKIQAISTGILPQGYDYDACNLNILLEMTEFENGYYVVNGKRKYRLLILPPNLSIDSRLLNKLRNWVAKGAIVYSYKPRYFDNLKDEYAFGSKLEEWSRALWGRGTMNNQGSHAYGKGRVFWGLPLKQVFQMIDLKPDFSHDLEDSVKISYIHKNEDKTDYYFISNMNPEPLQCVASFRVSGKLPSIWIPETGEIIPLKQYSETREGIALAISLSSYQSCFIVFSGTPIASACSSQSEEYPFPLKEKDCIFDDFKLHNICFKDALGDTFTVQSDTLFFWNDHTEKRIRYFSGEAVYNFSFTLPPGTLSSDQQIILSLPEVGSVAEVSINNGIPQKLWKSPFSMKVNQCLREGENQMQVRVVNSWYNRLLGDLDIPEDQRKTRTNNWNVIFPGSAPVCSGMKGKIGLYKPAM